MSIRLTPEQRGAIVRQGGDPDDYSLRRATVRIKLTADFAGLDTLSTEAFETSLMGWFERYFEKVGNNERKLKVTVEAKDD